MNNINSVIEKTKNELIEKINEKLQEGIPISIISLIIDNIAQNINYEKARVIQRENEVEE